VKEKLKKYKKQEEIQEKSVKKMGKIDKNGTYTSKRC
jgi:hypothetical protein